MINHDLVDMKKNSFLLYRSPDFKELLGIDVVIISELKRCL